MKQQSFIIGVGVGILICTIMLHLFAKPNVSSYYIEKKAREMGMMYPDEIKAYFDNN